MFNSRWRKTIVSCAVFGLGLCIFGVVRVAADTPAPSSDDALLDAIEAHPILLNRPLVVTPKGVKLCRPSEAVLDLLPPQQGEFIKEHGERVVDEHGRPVATA